MKELKLVSLKTISELVDARCSNGPPEELAINDVREIGPIRCQRFLGGVLRHYHRVAA